MEPILHLRYDKGQEPVPAAETIQIWNEDDFDIPGKENEEEALTEGDEEEDSEFARDIPQDDV